MQETVAFSSFGPFKHFSLCHKSNPLHVVPAPSPRWCKHLCNRSRWTRLHVPALRANKDFIQVENALSLVPAGFDNDFNLSTNPTRALVQDKLNHARNALRRDLHWEADIFGVEIAFVLSRWVIDGGRCYSWGGGQGQVSPIEVTLTT